MREEQVVATRKYDMPFLFHSALPGARTSARLPVYFPARLRQVDNTSESDPQIPRQTGKTDGQTEENEEQIRVHERRRVIIAPPPSKHRPVRLRLLGYLYPDLFVHICRKDITGSVPTRTLSQTTTSSTQLPRMKWTGARTILRLLDLERNPSLRTWDAGLAACSSHWLRFILKHSC